MSNTPVAHSPAIRIAVDLTPLRPGGQNGGVKPFIFEYIGWLGRQRRQPLQFIFLTRRSTHPDVRELARFEDKLLCVLDDASAIEVYDDLHSPGERLWPDAPDDLLHQLRVDLLYCPFGPCTWNFPGIPTIATVVDVLHRDYPMSLPPSEAAHRELVFEDLICRATMIQGISRYTLDRIGAHYDFPCERMFCSYIAIHDRLKASPAVAGNSRNRPYFLYPANAWAHKNHECLLLAYNIYRRQHGESAWDLVLTGHDDERMQNVLELARDLGIAERVRFLGHVKEDCYTDVWQAAGALVFPSLHEGFGIPLLEAMAFGLPIICSTAGALPEVGGEACLYVNATKPVELSAALFRIATDVGLRENLSGKGRHRLTEFSFENDARSFLERIVDCARLTPSAAHLGFYLDGWTGPLAAVTLPGTHGPVTLKIRTRPMPADRTLRIELNDVLLETITIPAGQAVERQIPFISQGSPLILRTPSASRLSETDPRTHGVWLESLVLCESDQSTQLVPLAV